MTTHPYLELQEIDSALDAVGHRRSRLPELEAHRLDATAVAEVHASMAAAQARIDAAATTIAAAEHSAGELTAKRTRLEAQLKTVIAPREAEALLSQIATLNTQRGECDDAELAALDEQAEAEADLAAHAARLPAAEGALAASAAALAAANAALDGEATDLGARREAVRQKLPASDLARYERVRAQFGGVGVAHLEGTHCSGCHMDLSPKELDVLRKLPPDELGECPQCGRMLVR